MNRKKHEGVGAKLRSVGLFFGFKEWVFALFLLAGIFKPNPESGHSAFDLTVLTALITLGCVAWTFFRVRRQPVGPFLLLLFFFLLFIPTLFWMDWSSYAVEKVSRFYTLTLLATVVPLYLVRTNEELRRFLSGFVFLCTVVAAAALVVMVSQGSELDRLMVLDATTIMTGRAVGAVTLVASLAWFEGCTNRFVVGIVLVILPTVLVATGAKGPIVATPLALFATLLLLRAKVRPYLTRLLLICLLGAGVFYLSLPIIPWTSLFRVGTFVAGQMGSSELDRVSFYADSLEGIKKSPEGLGLGGFASKFGVGGDEVREFPHNIVLEVFLEGGWVAGLYFMFLVVFGLARIYSAARNRGAPFIHKLVFCLIIFFLANDLVSGELNDSKVLLAFMGLAIGYGEFLPHTRSFTSPPVVSSLGPV
jgi:O-antigen ligase